MCPVDLDVASQNLAYILLILSSSPMFAKNILVLDDYGRGTSTPAGQLWKQNVFTALNTLRTRGMNVGYVDFSTIWDGVLGTNPGYQAFGYTNPGACLVNTSTTVGACSDPDHSFYWLPGYVPSTKSP